jgi:CubicO group peptidase (beta-lactamase class C family)
MKPLLAFVLATALMTQAHASHAAKPQLPLPAGKAEAAGFSAEGLARLDTFYNGEVAANRIPGAVVAIARNGKLVHFKAYGYLNKASGQAMPLDAIFPLASMTKLMASVAAMRLHEEGRLPLHAKLGKYLPEFEAQKVAVRLPSGELRLDDPLRPVLIHDLFRHTAGMSNGGPGRNGVHATYPNWFEADARQYVARIASLPMATQPGSAFDYSAATDVLGVVVETITGQALGDWMKTTVWDKVGMPDTRFSVAPEKRARLAQALPLDPLTGQAQSVHIYGHEPKFHCAGACAFGTVGDYLRFGQMLLNGGVIDGARVLSPKTVAYMTANHLSPSMQNNVAKVDGFREGYGFGLGVAVRVDDGIPGIAGSLGDYTWNGGFGTAFWNDPQERMVVVVGGVTPGDIRRLLREQTIAIVYGAMNESYIGRR